MRRVGRSPELVVMFVASEAAFSAAALSDAKLLEDAARDRVVIAKPATMVALLQAVGLAWREATLSERAERVRELAVDPCRRIAKFAEHLSNSGRESSGPRGPTTRLWARSRAGSCRPRAGWPRWASQTARRSSRPREWRHKSARP